MWPVSTHWVARWANSAADPIPSLFLMCSRSGFDRLDAPAQGRGNLPRGPAFCTDQPEHLQFAVAEGAHGRARVERSPADVTLGDPSVKRASRLPQQRAIGGVLHQRVLEEVARQRRRALPEQQACLNETVQRRRQLPLRASAPPPPAGRGRTPARSPPRSAPPPWRGRACRAAPSAEGVQSSPGPPRPKTEPPQPCAGPRPRSRPPAPPSSSPPRTGECRRCARRSPQPDAASPPVAHLPSTPASNPSLSC